MNNKKLIVLGLIALLLIGAGWFGYSRYQDYRKFERATAKLEQFIGYIDYLGVNNLRDEKICNRGHQKYSDGDISCFTIKSFTLTKDSKNNVTELVMAFGTKNGWKYKGKNTSQENVVSLLFTNQDMNCYFRTFNNDGLNKYEIGCYGSAKAEYFPVKE